MSVIGLLLAALLILSIGGAATIVGVAAEADDSAIAVPILGAVGAMTSSLIVLLCAPGLITGIGLMYFKPWARIVGIVLSAISLLAFPVGTAVGIYGLWVLLSRDTEPLFQPVPPGSQVPGSLR